MSLSVKSIASWAFLGKNRVSWLADDLNTEQSQLSINEKHTLATPRFSMAGILCPITSHLRERTKRYQWSSLLECSICPFQIVIIRTSKVQLALFQRIDVGKRVLDQLGGESHGRKCCGNVGLS